jgi:response regulator RpfG family c-di-GMP phosphodiesterase
MFIPRRTTKWRRILGSKKCVVSPTTSSKNQPREPTLRRKVLIIEDEPSISNLLYVLLDGLNYDGDVAMSGQQALDMIGRESFDAVLLDLRYSSISAEQMVLRITEIRPSLVGRVLVVTGQVDNPKAIELLERQCNPHGRQNRLMEEVHRSLLALWAIADLEVSHT